MQIWPQVNVKDVGTVCQDVYCSTRLDGTKVFILLCGCSGLKGNCNKRNQRSVRKVISNIQLKIDDLPAIFRRSIHRRRILTALLESWGHYKQNAWAFMQKYWLEILTLYRGSRGKHGMVSSPPILSKTVELMCNPYTRYQSSVSCLGLPTINFVVERKLGRKINDFGKR